MSKTSEPLGVAVLTISDTRTSDTDESGKYLQTSVESTGHTLLEYGIVKDDIYDIRASLSTWIARTNIDVILTSGGTGFMGRDSTPEAVLPLLDKKIDGFGEVFRAISYQDIGSSTIQSRALGGMANNTVIFCLPGATSACQTAWEGIIREQLDSNHNHCDFVAVLRSRCK